MTELEPIIGLEVHAQLRTRSKIFCSCEVRFGAPPNSLTCPVCLGMPGALPVMNRGAVALAVRLALALGCEVRTRSIFARKNYFYPDLPKGYQISQYDQPLAVRGRLGIEGGGEPRPVGITRVHMEEDAGKLIHEGPLAVLDASLVDFNRAGTPLVEIVGEPELRSPEEAYEYLTRLKSILTYTDVCDGNMEEGSLRCDANVSLREKGTMAFGTRVELKNLNSFRNVERALRYEIGRQEQVLRSGGTIVQETLLYDADTGTTRPMRSKEEAHDYRYFPDPDLLPLTVDEVWIDEIRQELPELPAVRRDRFVAAYGLNEADANLLTLEKPLADYFEDAVRGAERPVLARRKNPVRGSPEDRRSAPASGRDSERPSGTTSTGARAVGGTAASDARSSGSEGPSGAAAFAAPPKEIAKRVLREIMKSMKDEALDAADLARRYPPSFITEIVKLQEDGAVSGPTASDVFEYSWLLAGALAREGAAREVGGSEGRGALVLPRSDAEEDDERPRKIVTLLGFGVRAALVLSVRSDATLHEILSLARDAGVEEQALSGFASPDAAAVYVNGRLTKEGSLVLAGGSLLASADAIKGAAARPAEVGASPAAIVSAFGLGQISDEAAIRRAVEEAVSGNPKQLEQYRGGKESLFGFFVGQVMKATGGRANPALVNRILKEKLSE